MRFKLILFLFLISARVGVNAQDDLNFAPKLLFKELNSLKLHGNLNEIPLTPDIARQADMGKFFRIGNEKALYYIYIGRVNSCRAGGCTAENVNRSDGNSEYFDYFILFDRNGTVQKVRVYNYRATHGAEITATGWLNQFVGYDGRTGLSAGKDIDAISGATISVAVITYDVERKTRLLQSILNDAR
jgi:FMN-binding domain